MSEGIHLSHKSPQSDFDKLKGARLIQTAVPSDKYNGYILTNYDGIIEGVEPVKDQIKLSLEGHTDDYVMRSAVFTYEYTGLKGIAHFNEKDNRPTD